MKKVFHAMKQFFKKPEKQEKRKKFRIKGITLQKIASYVVMAIFLWMFAVTVVNVTQGSDTTQANEQKQQQDPQQVSAKNPAMKPGAVNFVKDFVSTYFTWKRTDEAKKQRKEDLAPYIANYLDEQAGLVYEGLEWDADYQSSEMKHIESTSKNTANYTIQVTYELHQEPSKEAIQKVKKQNKKLKKKAKEQDKDFEPKPLPDGKTKEVQKHVMISIISNGKGFAVYEYPAFVSYDATMQLEERPGTGSTVADDSLVNSIKEFLPTFFNSYTQDSSEELSYLLETKHPEGLNGSMTFERVENVHVYEANKGYDVQTAVIMRDPETGVTYKTGYNLTVQKQGGQWVVTSLHQKN